VAPKISVSEWQEKLAGCIRILRTHDGEMKELIGALSLVNRDIPPNEVWGGVPARLLRRDCK